MICDFLKSFSREEKPRAKAGDRQRPASRIARDATSHGRSPAIFSHTTKREMEP